MGLPKMKWLVTFILLNLSNFMICNAFNVDLPSIVIHRSPQPGSMFGFSVALYKYGNVNTLLVGAPKFDTEQPGVYNGGAVLNCSSQYSNTRCEYVPFDISGNNVHPMGFSVDNKTNQFFGATLKSSGTDGIVVACAPRYVWFTESVKRREPVGTCYVARHGLTDFQEFSPCRTGKWGYHRQGSCQAGFDAALSTNGDRMYIGAPGAFYWQGQIHSQSLVTRNEYFTTGEGPATEDDQYLGYSVAAGDFTGDGVQDVALGVPKGLNYTGKVALYSHDLQWLQNITGDQLGSYFGYCLAVVDFNGDKFDDIVVGAPLYTDFEDKEMKIEVGKVHVLLQNNGHYFRRKISFLGLITKGRFGLSVASLGDINLDGYGDFAVGAPYSGEDGRGAVFIYHGFATPDRETIGEEMKRPAQVIYAAEISSGFTTFGWSLSGGLDMDGNQYPDLLVGAYEAESAFFFKSRPIIKFLEHKLEFQSQGKTIDIQAENCRIKGGQPHTCMDLIFCLTYSGVNVDDNIELEVEYRLDTKQNSEQRLLFESNEQGVFREKIQYKKELNRCRTLKTFVKPGLVDKLTPITANVSYTLMERRRSPRALTPVLNQDQTLSMQDSLTIQKNCGPDNICIPDLVLTFEAADHFIIDQKEMFFVSIRVVNNGEDAFESVVYISEPKGLLFNKFEPRVNTSCSTRKIDGNSVVKCDIGNPLPKHHSVSFKVFFQLAGALEEPRFEFLVTANSTNAEELRTSGDNVARKIVQAKVDVQLTLFGSSDPENILYNSSLYMVPVRRHEKHVGPTLVHKYGILSIGPSDVEDTEIIILWPSRTLSGSHLLYLMEQPITVGDVTCENVPDVNPLGLELISSEDRTKVLRLTSLESTHKISSGGELSEISSGREGSYSASSSSEGGYSSSSSSKTEKSYSSSVSSSSTGESISSQSSSKRGGGGSSSHSSTTEGETRGADTSSVGEGGRRFSSSVSSSSSRGGSGGYSASEGEARGQHSVSSTRGSGSEFSSSSRKESEGSYSASRGGNMEHSSSGSQGIGGSYTYSQGERSGGAHSSRDGGAHSSRDGGAHSSRDGGRVSYSSGSSSGGNEESYFSSSRERSGGSHSATSGSGKDGEFSLTPRGGSGGQLSTSLYTVRGGSGGGAESAQSANRGTEERRYHSSATSSGVSEDIPSSRSESEGTYYSSSRGRGEGDRTYSSSTQGGRDGGRSSSVYSSSRGVGGEVRETEGGGRGTYSSSTHTGGERRVYSSSSRDGDVYRHQLSGGENDGHHYSTGDGSESGGESYYSSGSYSKKSSPSSSSSSRTSTSYKSSSSGSFDEIPFYDNVIETRRKRDVDPLEQWERLTSDCGPTICTRIKCRAGRLSNNNDVYIYIRSRLWVDTLNEDPMYKFPVDDVTITTRMVARANVMPQGITSEYIKVYSKNVTTPIRPAKSLADVPPIPWWVILLATLAGLLILLLIILILWRCGYFKRHRPRHKARVTDDAQPLNPSNGTNGTNGLNGQHKTSRPFYPGDEAL